MTPTWRIFEGDCREQMATLDAGSVQTCVTSPPYFGLRDYGTGEWDGGADDCDHVRWVASNATDPGIRNSTLQSNKKTRRLSVGTVAQLGQQGRAAVYERECGRCGAKRIDSQIGQEVTVEQYAEALVSVFAGVRRVLRDDGTVWLNLGDSYAPGKQLLGVPWAVAKALQDDGWILRSDIIWSKENPLPEPVTDRPTKAHEYLFLLSKQPRYFYDAHAIKEPATLEGAARNKRSVWTVAPAKFPGAHFATFPPKLIEPCILAGSRRGDVVLDPFSGAGTTGLVALRHDRSYIGCELNPEYVELSRGRIIDDSPLLNTFAEAA